MTPRPESRDDGGYRNARVATRGLPLATEGQVSETGQLSCAWCQRGFAPRADGGRKQRFCSERCRRAFDAGGRRWVAAALAEGTLTVDELVHFGALKLPPPTDAGPDDAARRPAEAARLIDELVVRFTELDKPDFMLVLKTLGPALVKQLLDAAGPASH